MKNSIKITECNKLYPLTFIKENPYLKIDSVELISGINENDHPLELLRVNTQSENNSADFKIDTYNWNKSNCLINYEFDTIDFDRVFLYIPYIENIVDFEVEIFYTFINIIDIDGPFKKFDYHLKNMRNEKIIISAPFGHGKSTFLNLFFEQKTEDYNVFKVYPLNYSISSNRDIFRYIKTDVLFQLLAYNIEWDENDISFTHAASELFLGEEKKDMLTSLIKIFFSLDKKHQYLIKAIDPFIGLYDKIKLRQRSVNDGQRREAESYLKEVYQKEGSIYEDNELTQLIRLFLEQIKLQNKNHKNVLIIEDLDRMDPDHIFRILNVISAHIDTHRHEDFISSNKFGFDKIILVADINNLESIYNHKFGKSTDFDGYMNKFYSSTPFKYDNKEAFKSLIKPYTDSNEILRDDNYVCLVTYEILTALFDARELSIRDFLRISINTLADSIRELRHNFHSTSYSYGIVMPLLNILLKAYSKESLIEKFKVCQSKRIHESHRLNDFCLDIIVGLSLIQNNLAHYNHKGEKLIIEIDHSWRYEFKTYNRSSKNKTDKDLISNGLTAKKIFSIADYYDLIILSVEQCDIMLSK